MLQQFLCAFPLIRRLSQAAVHEVDKVVAAFCQFRRISIDDALHCQVMLHAQKWRFSFYQLNCHHSQRPYVYLLIIRLLFNQLRSHPSRCSHQRFPAQYFLGELDSEAKVRDLDFSLQTHQHIIALEITMQLPSTVQTLQPFQHILQDVSDDVFWYFFEIIVNEVYHCAAVHELNKHEERLLVVIGEVMSGEICGVAEIHHCDFCTNFIECTVVFELYDAAGVVLPVCLCAVVGEENLAHCALPEFFLEDELTCWVLFNEMHVFYHGLKLTCRQQFGLNVTLNQGRVVFLLLKLIMRIFRIL